MKLMEHVLSTCNFCCLVNLALSCTIDMVCLVVGVVELSSLLLLLPPSDDDDDAKEGDADPPDNNDDEVPCNSSKNLSSKAAMMISSPCVFVTSGVGSIPQSLIGSPCTASRLLLYQVYLCELDNKDKSGCKMV